MKTRITILAVACLILAAFSAKADSMMLKASGGKYVYTVPYKGPVELGSVAFTLPRAITNTFEIAMTRNIIERVLRGNVITTNLYGRIETNTSSQILSETNVVVTNLLFSVSTTNVAATQVYDKANHLPYAFQATEGDKFVYTWTETNSFYFIQTIEPIK